MALTDPQSITINAITTSLPRTGSGINSGSFQSNDGTIGLVASHAYGKRQRRTIRLNHQKYAADPLVSSQNVLRSASVYLVIDTPLQGYSVTEQKQIVDGLTAWLTASSGANVTKLLGGES